MLKYKKETEYSDYQRIQIRRSCKKWDATTFDDKLFCKILLTALPDMKIERTNKIIRPDSICCMGIRNGNEYFAFKKYQKSITELKNSKIIGIDINPEVVKIGDDCYCYDFNELPTNWKELFDLVYSNSIDHSYNLQETLKEWHRILRDGRYLLLTLSNQGNVSSSDRYSFDEEDIVDIFDGLHFELKNVWKEFGQVDSFNVLVRKYSSY
jgi:SAM-dependent methyltransferase